MDSKILEMLVDTMQYFGAIEKLSGQQKKIFVLKSIDLKINLPDETKETLMNLIDILIQVENHKIIINPKIEKLTKSLFSSCCS